jgi:anti-sigma B factor antagonist
MALAQDRYPHLVVWAVGEARRLRRAALAQTRSGDHPAGTGSSQGWSTHRHADVGTTSYLHAVPPLASVAPIASPSRGNQQFRLEASFAGDQAVLAVVGEVDVATASQLEECLVELLHRPLERLTVDMSATTFIDSKGLTALVAGLSRARDRDVEFTLASPTASVLKILEIAGVEQLLPVE